MAKVDHEVYKKVLALAQHAESKDNRGECFAAAKLYLEDLALLPEPLEECEESMWLSGRAANAFFRNRKYQQAYDELRRTLRLSGATANPLIWLRHGQCLYELGQTEAAKQSLFRAYMLEGEEIFVTDHPKYWELIAAMVSNAEAEIQPEAESQPEAEIELLPENVGEFRDRFSNGHDGVIDSIKLEFVFERQGRRYHHPMLEVVVEIPDRDSDSGFSRVTFFVEGVKELKIFEGPTTSVALSSGIKIGFFQERIYLTFDHYMEHENDPDRFKESDFYVIGARCFYSVAHLK